MKRTIKEVEELSGKKVLLRADFNVPLDENTNAILDTTRITEELPTIQYLVEAGAKVIVCSHLGRPTGVEEKYSLKPVADELAKHFEGKVTFCPVTIGTEAKKMVRKLKDGEILVLENVRFDEREEANDPKFAKELASLAEFYVNDAFGTAHRKHASTYGVAEILPSAIGFLIEKELSVIENAYTNPQRPFVAVLGGAKVKDKINVIKKLIDVADTVLIGGGMAFTFLAAQGRNIGDSLFAEENLNDAKNILKLAEKKGKKLLLPIDNVALENNKVYKVVEMHEGMEGLDIGPKTVKMFIKEIKKAGQIVWNGPVGKYEDKRFAKGTNKIAKAIAKSKAFSIIGGGDSISAINACGCAEQINHLSTGGGASLKLMEGSSLPAVDIIGKVKKLKVDSTKKKSSAKSKKAPAKTKCKKEKVEE